MKSKYCLLFFLLATGVQAVAQHRIKGEVQDKAGQGAPYATVTLVLAKDSSIVKGAVADESGIFEMGGISQGSYLINVQYLGFTPKWSSRFELNDLATEVDLGGLMLEERIGDLAEVTVKGQRSLVEQTGDRMVLNVGNSVIAKGNKVIDLLRYAPLVRLTDGGVKVGNKGSVLILIDGRQTGQGALANFLQNFSAEDILKIEVLTNPPAKYDAGFGAVIDIITKKSLEMGVNGRVAVNYSQGTYGRFTPDGSLNFRRGKWSLFSGISASVGDYHHEQSLKRRFPESILDNRVDNLERNKTLSFFSGINFTPNAKNTIGLRLSGSGTGKEGKTKTQTSFKSQSSVPDSLLMVSNQNKESSSVYDVNIYYIRKLDTAGKEISLTATRSFFDRSSNQNLTYQRQNPVEGNVEEPARLRIINPTDQESFVGQADLSIPLPKGGWSFGMKYVSIGNRNDLRQEHYFEGGYRPDTAFSSGGSYREHTYAGYTGYNKVLGRAWSLQAGLRLEHTSQELIALDISRRYTGIFPSMSLNKAFANGNSFNASYSRKIARPGLYSLVPFRTIVDPYSIMEGNPLLKPSFANSVDVYYTFGRFSLFSNYTHTKDLISDVLLANAETKIYIQTMGNLESVNDLYAGVSWGQDIVRWWKTNSTFTVSGTRTKSPIADTPEVNVNGYGVVVNSTNIFTLRKGYRVELFLNYNSPNRYTIWKTRALYWASLSINKKLFRDGNLRVVFEDIFRTQVNRIHVGYGPVDIASRNYSDAQRVRVSFSYNLGRKTVKATKYRSLGNEEEKNRMGGR